MIRRISTVAVATVLAVAGGTGSAHAGGGGYNHGTAGAVFESTTVGGIAMSGTCEFVIEGTRARIVGAMAASPGVFSTWMSCSLRQDGVLHSAVGGGSVLQFTGANGSTGGAYPGLAICIEMGAVRADSTPIASAPFCVG